jgi:hypothetical protein
MRADTEWLSKRQQAHIIRQLNKIIYGNIDKTVLQHAKKYIQNSEEDHIKANMDVIMKKFHRQFEDMVEALRKGLRRTEKCVLDTTGAFSCPMECDECAIKDGCATMYFLRKMLEKIELIYWSIAYELRNRWGSIILG